MSVLSIVPIVSEKGFAAAEGGTYLFAVPIDATKAEISREVERSFAVKVADVRTLRLKGKEIRSRTRKRNVTGRRAEAKKAYVKLAPGQTIALFED